VTWDLQKAGAECRLEAAELQRKARRAWLPSNKRFYLEMADNFLRLAEGYEMQLIVKQNNDRLNEIRTEPDVSLLEAE
jgi:hypothetical protein